MSQPKRNRDFPKDKRYINGNHTRIDPTEDIYPMYTTMALTQAPDTLNGNLVPILPINKVMDSKEDVDNTHL